MKKHLLYFLAILMSHYLLAGTNPKDTSSPSHVISILTYNVKMLPRAAVSIGHHPVIRARLIPAKLMEESPDIIVFQEGFDGLAIRILKRRLKDMYPYNAGYNNHLVVTYKRAGGVLMFSKYPMKEIESIKYTQCKGIDCLGRKGALLVEVQHPAHKIQVLGTHMQAGGSKELKKSQYAEAGELLKRYAEPGVPQFAAGDYNTHLDNPELYNALLTSMDAENVQISGENIYTTDHDKNDMSSYHPGKHGIIDFVLYRGNGVTPLSSTRIVRIYQQQWSRKHKDLSDHYAVLMKMKL